MHHYFISTLRCAILACALLFAAQSQAQTQIPAQAGAAIADRYPPGSISSVDTAERALAEAALARADIEAAYAQGKVRCYPAFFTTSCLDHIAEQRRTALASLRPIEIEAETFKRRARVVERDNDLAEHERQMLEDARARVANAATPAARAGGPAPAPSPAEQRAEQKKREDNIRAYEKKQQEASIRLREREAKNASRPD